MQPATHARVCECETSHMQDVCMRGPGGTDVGPTFLSPFRNSWPIMMYMQSSLCQLGPAPLGFQSAFKSVWWIFKNIFWHKAAPALRFGNGGSKAQWKNFLPLSFPRENLPVYWLPLFLFSLMLAVKCRKMHTHTHTHTHTYTHKTTQWLIHTLLCWWLHPWPSFQGPFESCFGQQQTNCRTWELDGNFKKMPGVQHQLQGAKNISVIQNSSCDGLWHLIGAFEFQCSLKLWRHTSLIRMALTRGQKCRGCCFKFRAWHWTVNFYFSAA